MSDFATMAEVQQLAEAKLPKEIWDYANGGSASETTLRRNRAALARWAIEQRVLMDVHDIDLSVEFLGKTLPLPVIVAPMGSLYRFWDRGDIEMAVGAGREGGRAGRVLHDTHLQARDGGESDRQLIARWKAGDSRAASLLVSRHADALARFAALLVGVFGRSHCAEPGVYQGKNVAVTGAHIVFTFLWQERCEGKDFQVEMIGESVSTGERYEEIKTLC